MMRISFDFDDTLLDTRRVFVNVLNRIHGTNHQLDSLLEYYLAGTFGRTSDYLEQVFTDHLDELHELNPLPGVVDTIRRLEARGDQLTILTARPDIHMPPLHQWLRRHGLPAAHVINAPKSGEKALRAAEERMELHVDDNPRHALAIAARNIRVLLLDRPYNRTCEASNITRVADWPAIADFLFSSNKCQAVLSRQETAVGSPVH